ncbi:MAG: hypothetical protein C5B52_05660, partial [Bacteroidetes bacterium]
FAVCGKIFNGTVVSANATARELLSMRLFMLLFIFLFTLFPPFDKKYLYCKTILLIFPID